MVKKKLLTVRVDKRQNLSKRMQSLEKFNINPNTGTENEEENNMAKLYVVHDSGVNDKSLYAADRPYVVLSKSV